MYLQQGLHFPVRFHDAVNTNRTIALDFEFDSISSLCEYVRIIQLREAVYNLYIPIYVYIYMICSLDVCVSRPYTHMRYASQLCDFVNAIIPKSMLDYRIFVVAVGVDVVVLISVALLRLLSSTPKWNWL